MIQHRLEQAYTCLLNVLIATIITYIGIYLLYGCYWTLELHHDPDREILIQFLLGWIEADEL